MLRSGMFVAAMLASASVGLAAAITVPNPSFEDDSGYGGTWGGAPASWNRGETLGAGASTVLQVVNTAPFAGKDLNNFLFMNVDGGPVQVADTTTNTIWTSSLGTYAADTTYTLTVALATEATWTANRSATIALQADGVVVQSVTKLFTELSSTDFQDFSVVLDTQTMPGIVGQNISVLISHSVANEQYGKTLAVDNVRLDATPVPEPAAFGTLAVAGALVLRRRR